MTLEKEAPQTITQIDKLFTRIEVRLTYRGMKDVSKWWNEHIGSRFEDDMNSWVVNKFTKIDAKNNWANTGGTALDESEDENYMNKAFSVARGRHLRSDFIVLKYVHESKELAKKIQVSEAVALEYVKDRLSSDEGVFNILGITTERKREQLLDLVA